MKIKPSQKHCTAKNPNQKVKGKPEEDGGGDNKPCNLNQRRQSRIQSLESSAVEEQVEAKEGTNRKRQSRRTQSLGISALEEQRETKEMVDDESEEVGGTVPANGGDNKPCNLNRSRRPRTQSLGCSALQDQVTLQHKLSPTSSGVAAPILQLIATQTLGMDGARAEKILDMASITLNKNSVPGDKSALIPGGIRIGTPAMTTRGFTEKDFVATAYFIHEGIQIALEAKKSVKGSKLQDFMNFIGSADFFSLNDRVADLQKRVEDMTTQFPLPGL